MICKLTPGQKLVVTKILRNASILRLLIKVQIIPLLYKINVRKPLIPSAEWLVCSHGPGASSQGLWLRGLPFAALSRDTTTQHMFYWSQRIQYSLHLNSLLGAHKPPHFLSRVPFFLKSLVPCLIIWRILPVNDNVYRNHWHALQLLSFIFQGCFPFYDNDPTLSQVKINKLLAFLRVTGIRDPPWKICGALGLWKCQG